MFDKKHWGALFGIVLIMVAFSNVMGITASIVATIMNESHEFSWAVFGSAFVISMLFLANALLLILGYTLCDSVREK